MHRCQNPECDKEIPDSLDFCTEDCKNSYKNSSKAKPKTKDQNEDFDLDPSMQALKKSIGSSVTLILSRGPTIRGRLIGFDPKFRKVAVEQETANSTETTYVSLGYVIAISLRKLQG